MLDKLVFGIVHVFLNGMLWDTMSRQDFLGSPIKAAEQTAGDYFALSFPMRLQSVNRRHAHWKNGCHNLQKM
jgi:hypothetical protein